MGYGLSKSPKNKITPDSQADVIAQIFSAPQANEVIESQPGAQKNDEEITLIWVGECLQGSDFQTVRITLRGINNYIKVFVDTSECLTYLDTVDKENIFIIIYGSAINEQMVSKTNSIQSVDTIFLFDLRKDPKTEKLYADLKHDYNKVTFFANFNEMCVNIKESIKQLIKQAVGFSLFDEKEKSTMDLTRDAATFLWFQMLFNVLKRQFQNETVKREMIVACRRVYNGNHNEMANIARYHQDDNKALNAVNWYTQECFLYRLVNKALRTEDIDSLCTFSPFIVDLCNQLTEEHEKRVTSDADSSTSIIELYRGQQMSQTEVDKMAMNKGKLISTNGFFSTTLSKDVAMNFAKQRRIARADIVAVIFEIKAKSDLKTVIFADIRHLSAMGPDEQEVLFSIGAVFRIGQVIHDKNRNLWTVSMIATDEGYENVLPYIEATAQNREETSYNVLFGRLLNDMGRYQQAEAYCNTLLQTMANNHPDMAGVCHNLGRAQGHKGQLKEAAASFTQALVIRKAVDMDHPNVARTLNSLGIVHGEKGEYAKAMEKFKQALEIQSKNTSIQKGEKSIDEQNLLLDMAVSHSNMGWVHGLRGEYDKACQAHGEALKIRKGLLKVNDHPLFADYHSSMGGIAHAKGSYDNARTEYTRALHMRQKVLPPTHPSIANSYQSLGEIEHDNGKYERALDYYEQALRMRTETLGLDHLSTAFIYKSIGGVHLDSGAYDKAREFYDRALVICQTSLTADHPTVGDCYHLIGTVCERQGNYEKALEYYRRAHNIILKSLPKDHPMVAKIYSSIASVKMRQQQYEQALAIYNSVLNIQKKCLNQTQHHPDLALTLNNFGVLFRCKKDYVQAEKYFKDALEMCDKCFQNSHPARARTLHNMGEMYLALKKFDQALKNFEDAIGIRLDTLPDNDLSTADTFYKAGYVCFEKADYAQALNYFTKSQGIYESKHDGYDAEVKRTQRSIAMTQEVLGMGYESVPMAS